MDDPKYFPEGERLPNGTWQFTVVVDGQTIRWTGLDPADGEAWARRCTAPTTEVELPPNAIILDGETNAGDLATFQTMLCKLHAESEANRAKIASGEYRASPGSRRTEPMDLSSVAAFRVQLDRMKRSVKPAVPRVACRAKVRRTAPRRLAVRRHRRAARSTQKTGTDDGSSPEPPSPKTAVVLSCAALALGFAIGAVAALVPR